MSDCFVCLTSKATAWMTDCSFSTKLHFPSLHLSVATRLSPGEIKVGKRGQLSGWSTGLVIEKFAGLSPRRSGGWIFFSWVNFLCRLLFCYPFYHHVTTVAHKRFWSFCIKCKWQVTAKHACILCTWLCMKWHDLVHGCMVYAERTKTAAVSCGTSHVTTKRRCTYTTFVDIQNVI